MIKIDFVFFKTFYLLITLPCIVYFLLSSCWWWWDWWWITSSKLNQFHCVFVLFLLFFFDFFENFSLFKNTKLFYVLYDIFNFKVCYLKKGFQNSKKIIFLEQNRMIFYEKTQILWNEIEEFRIKWNLFLKIFLVFLVVKYFCTNLQPLIFQKWWNNYGVFIVKYTEIFLIIIRFFLKKPCCLKNEKILPSYNPKKCYS